MLGAWRGLDEAGRVAWLDGARDRALLDGAFGARSAVTIDGDDFDDLTGFFCAIGEAVNGPGGYFGARLSGFDDCLFGGFGLEPPYTITWLNAARSRVMLGSEALCREVTRAIAEIDANSEPEQFAEARRGLVETLGRAQRGELTLFDDLVERIESVPSRGSRAPWAGILRLA